MGLNSKYIYSGSFNPLHSGHLAIANYVESKFNVRVLFEFCKMPYDKSSLSQEDIDTRLNQFNILGRRCVVSKNTSYLQKSFYEARVLYFGEFPIPAYEIVFLVGSDTISRIDDPKYYFGSEFERDRCLKMIGRNKASFLVFPRSGHLTYKLSPATMELCQFAEDDFVPIDISSSDIRKSLPNPIEESV